MSSILGPMRVLYFGPCRIHAGCDGEDIPLAPGATVRELLDACCARHPAVAAVRASLQVAVDREFAPASTVLKGSEEVAVMPPLSGG